MPPVVTLVACSLNYIPIPSHAVDRSRLRVGVSFYPAMVIKNQPRASIPLMIVSSIDCVILNGVLFYINVLILPYQREMGKEEEKSVIIGDFLRTR